jgi:hypothetical protein
LQEQYRVVFGEVAGRGPDPLAFIDQGDNEPGGDASLDQGIRDMGGDNRRCETINNLFRRNDMFSAV